MFTILATTTASTEVSSVCVKLKVHTVLRTIFSNLINIKCVFGRSRYGIHLLSYVSKKMCTRYIMERTFDCTLCSQATIKSMAQIYVKVLIFSSQGAKDTEYLFENSFLLKANSRHFRGLSFWGGKVNVSCLIQEVDNVITWSVMCVLWQFCFFFKKIWYFNRYSVSEIYFE